MRRGAVNAATDDQQDAASFEKIDKAAERVCKHLEGSKEINSAANNTKNAADKMLSRARLIQEAFSAQLQIMVNEILKGKEDPAKDKLA